MSSISRSALVPYSAQEMYDLVADVESYPRFLPWCGGARVLSRDDTHALASIDIAYHGLHKTFTTHNTLQPAQAVEMHLVEGPFKHLHGFWRFQGLDRRSSRISLDLEFDFASKALALALGPLFRTIVNSLVESFSNRATAIYGEREWSD